MKINTLAFQEALTIVEPGLASKEFFEQTKSFAFKNSHVITYNDDISISHPIDRLDFEGAIKAKLLYKYLGKIDSKEIEVSINRNEFYIVSGQSKACFNLQSEVKLPLDEQIVLRGDWKQLPENFIKYVGFALFSCFKYTFNPALNCIHITKEGIIESTDSDRITRCELGEEMPVTTFLLPLDSAVEVVKLNPLYISEPNNGWVHFKTELGTVISCRVFKGKFPNCLPYFVLEGKELTFPNEFEECLERAMVFSKRDYILDECIYITVKNNLFKLEAKGRGWFEEEQSIEYQGEPIHFEITPYLIKEIIKETQTCLYNEKRLKFEGEGWQHILQLRNRTKSH